VTATYVELVDGRVVTRDAEEWRNECMARHVLAMPLEDRREWLAEFEKKHGPEETAHLKSAMTAVHEVRRADAAAKGKK